MPDFDSCLFYLTDRIIFQNLSCGVCVRVRTVIKSVVYLYLLVFARACSGSVFSGCKWLLIYRVVIFRSNSSMRPTSRFEY